VKELSKDRLLVEGQLGKKQALQLPLSMIAAISFQGPAGSRDPDAARFRRRLLTERRNRDVIMLKNGDLLQGALARLDAKSLTIQAAGKPISVERDKVTAIAFNTELARSPSVKGAYARLVLADGARLSIAEGSADPRTLSAKTLFGATVEVPISNLVALDILQGRAVYLAGLKPRRYDYTPFLGTDFHSYSADGNWEGSELRLAGSVYDRGLGMHSKSTITYDLAGGYQRFEALVGIDDTADRCAAARVQVFLDGKPADLAWNGKLARPDPPWAIQVKMAAARRARPPWS